MSDIVRRSDLTSASSIVRVDRQTGRALAVLRSDSQIRESEDLVAARLVQLRVDSAHQLGSRAVMELKGLHSLISELSRDNAGLEMELRQIESIVSIGTQQALVNFMSRPL